MKLIQILIKFLFYLSSFTPLYFLLIVQNLSIRDSDGNLLSKGVFFYQFYESTPKILFWGSTTLAIILSILFIVLFRIFYLDSQGVIGKLVDESLERGDTLGYIITYIIPLLSMEVGSYRSLTINLVLFMIIGIFYIKDNQLFMNPIFNMMGYRILISDDNIYITKLSRRRMKEIAREKEDVIKIPISEEIFIIKEVD